MRLIVIITIQWLLFFYLFGSCDRKLFLFVYLYDADGYGTCGRADAGAGRLEYTGHVEYDHVYAAHLLEEHASDADQKSLTVGQIR